MSQHESGAVAQAIAASSAEERMEALKKELARDLRMCFETTVGCPLPPAHDADVQLLSVGGASQYCHLAKNSEFIAGVRTLLRDRFEEDTGVRNWVMGVADKAIGEIFVAAAQNSGAQGYHDAYEVGTDNHLSKLLLAAAYASSRLCNHQDWGTEHDFYVSQYAFTVFKMPLHEIVGKYECHLYDNNPTPGAKNDVHYVIISRVEGSDTELWWENRANLKWKLTATRNRTLLKVAPDSWVTKTYGSTEVEVVWDGSHVSGLYGSGHEFYQKESG